MQGLFNEARAVTCATRPIPSSDKIQRKDTAGTAGDANKAVLLCLSGEKMFRPCRAWSIARHSAPRYFNLTRSDGQAGVA